MRGGDGVSGEVIKGSTCPESIKRYLSRLIEINPDGEHEWTAKLIESTEKWVDENQFDYGNGQLGFSVEDDRVNHYTWSFGQKTKRRMYTFVKEYTHPHHLVFGLNILPNGEVEEDVLLSFISDESETVREEVVDI